MSTLCDSQLIELCKMGMVSHFDEALVNPASIDLRVGTMARVERLDSCMDPEQSLWGAAFELGSRGFMLFAGQSILLDTLEYVQIPVHCMAEMWLKSSAGRNGGDMYKAGYIDPGFHGTLTFRYRNDMKRPILIKPGLRLVQMVVREMSKVPDKPYTMTGRYNGQTGPTEARL